MKRPCVFSLLELFMADQAKKNGVLPPHFRHLRCRYTVAELATCPEEISPVFLIRSGM